MSLLTCRQMSQQAKDLSLGWGSPISKKVPSVHDFITFSCFRTLEIWEVAKWVGRLAVGLPGEQKVGEEKNNTLTPTIAFFPCSVKNPQIRSFWDKTKCPDKWLGNSQYIFVFTMPHCANQTGPTLFKSVLIGEAILFHKWIDITNSIWDYSKFPRIISGLIS